MKHIKILGTGCAKCHKTEEIVRHWVSTHHIEASIEKVEDIQQILTYNVLSTPAVVVDEVVICSGRIPREKDLMPILIAMK